MVQSTLLSLMLLVALLPRATGQQPQRPTTEPSKPATTQPQNPPDVDSQDVVKITTNLVQVDAVVTKDGKQVNDLKPEDFQLFEDGKPQTITNFSYISNVSTVPLNVAVTPPGKDKNGAPVVPAAVRPHDVHESSPWSSTILVCHSRASQSRAIRSASSSTNSFSRMIW